MIPLRAGDSMNDLDSLPLTPPLTIAVVYQDSLTQRWTAELCARAKVQCGQGTMQCAHWRLDTLSDPAVFKRAVAFALQANLLVIAAYAHMNLPSDVKRWVQTGSQQGRAHKGALVALLGKCSFAGNRFRPKSISTRPRRPLVSLISCGNLRCLPNFPS